MNLLIIKLPCLRIYPSTTKSHTRKGMAFFYTQSLIMEFSKKFITYDREAIELRFRDFQDGTLQSYFEIEIYRQSSRIASITVKDTKLDVIVQTVEKQELVKTANEIIEKLTQAIKTTDNGR